MDPFGVRVVRVTGGDGVWQRTKSLNVVLYIESRFSHVVYSGVDVPVKFVGLWTSTHVTRSITLDSPQSHLQVPIFPYKTPFSVLSVVPLSMGPLLSVELSVRVGEPYCLLRP